ENNLYLIASHYNYGIYEDEEQLPLPLDCLYYMEDMNAQYSLTNFLTLDFTDADSNPNVMGIYMSSASTIYVSQKNIYISHMKPFEYQESDDEWGSPVISEEKTVIHRIGIQGQGLKYRARGEVPGWVLNRFSMDEHNGHFRIASTKGWTWGAGEDMSKNIVTVLDMALNETGVLGDIAPGEQIYSARFMGDRCYLVTFRQIDPFFVIDLHDAENPEILGELKIPGYSSYLHPYDENHVIGLGKDGSSVKISLFNVTDVTNPTELDNYQIEGDYSQSAALYDPHAFTFDYQKGLLVIPIYQYTYTYLDYVGSSGSSSQQSAMVFHISPEDGIKEIASIEHPEQGQNEWGWDYNYRSNQIHRSFFIGDTLYTVSDWHMKASNLENYRQEALVELD
ncbi:MAG: beta-propeller domain-containing protein, partial [Thermoplasmata archaeon]|nr:beta-propeller domain-containing protein [Thermoplasmata archaeon]